MTLAISYRPFGTRVFIISIEYLLKLSLLIPRILICIIYEIIEVHF